MKVDCGRSVGTLVKIPLNGREAARSIKEIVTVPTCLVLIPFYATFNNPFCMNAWIVQNEMQNTRNWPILDARNGCTGRVCPP